MKNTTLSPETQILIDVHPKTGAIVPWQRKKQETILLAESCRRIEKIDPGFKGRAAKLEECGNWLEFHRTIKDGILTLSRANFCKYRLCFMCAWRRSLKIFGQTSQIMDEAEKLIYRFLFVTLTIKNCHKVNLSRDITRLYSGATNLLRQKKYKNSIKGWMRILEVTHNTNIKDQAFDTYHPHLHFIFAVKPSYFKGGKNYITQSQLTNDWQKSCNLDYKPITDIRAVNNKKKGAIREVAKYAVKPSDILVPDHDLTDSAVWTLDQALENRRMVSYGGIFKTIKADLMLDDAEFGDLVHTDSNPVLNDELDYIVEKYRWNVGLSFHQRVK
jgi:plasmid rolling circle replication initiator protein Rep